MQLPQVSICVDNGATLKTTLSWRKPSGGLNSYSRKVKSCHWHRWNLFTRRTKSSKIIVVPTSICRHLKEIIQDSIDKGLLKYNDKGKIAVNVMMESHDPLCDQFLDAPYDEDVPSLVIDLAITEVNKVKLADDGLVDHWHFLLAWTSCRLCHNDMKGKSDFYTALADGFQFTAKSYTTSTEKQDLLWLIASLCTQTLSLV